MGLDFKFRQEGRITWQVGKQWCHMVLRATHVKTTHVRSCERNLESKLSFKSEAQFEPERWQIGGSPEEKCGNWSRRRNTIFGVNQCMWSVSMPLSMIGPWMCRNLARFLRSDSGSIRFKTLRCRSPTRQTQVNNHDPMGYPYKSLTITIQLSNHV